MRRPLALLVLLAGTASAQPVTVEITGPPSRGARLGVRGDTPPLAWDRSLLMEVRDGTASATIPFPTGTGRVAYKVVVEGADGQGRDVGARRQPPLLPGRMTTDRRAFGGPQAELPVLTLSQAEVGRRPRRPGNVSSPRSIPG